MLCNSDNITNRVHYQVLLFNRDLPRNSSIQHREINLIKLLQNITKKVINNGFYVNLNLRFSKQNGKTFKMCNFVNIQDNKKYTFYDYNKNKRA